MKVAELIERLKCMPPDSEVFVYCSRSEDDGRADDVVLGFASHENRDQMADYYSQGISLAREYIRQNPNEVLPVIIGSGFYSFGS